MSSFQRLICMRCNLEVHTAKDNSILRSSTEIPLDLGHQGLHHQQESQARTVSTGSQPPTLGNTKTAFNPSAHVTAGHSGCYGTSNHGCSVRPSVNESEQRRECSKGQFSRCFLNASNLNKTGLQQRKHLTCEFSAGGNSAALQEDCLDVAETPPKVQGSSMTAQERCPLLLELRTGNLLESKSFFTSGSCPEEANANMELNTVIHDAERGPHGCLPVEGSLTALDCGQTRTQALHHLEFPSVPVSPPSHRLQTSNHNKKTKPPTKKAIHAIIEKKLALYSEYLMLKKQNNSMLLSMQSHHYTTAASKEDVARQDKCVATEEPSAAAGKALEEEEASKSSMPNDPSTAASEKPSTEYPQMLKVAATSTKNEAESLGVLTAVPGTTWKDQRKKRPSFQLNRNLSQEESRRLWLNVNTYSDDVEIGPGVCTEREKGSAALNTVETVGLDNTKVIADHTKSSSESGPVAFGLSSLSEYQKAKKKLNHENSHHHICKKGTATSNSSVCKTAIPNMLSIPTNQSERQSSQTRRASEDAAFASSQAISGTSVPIKALQKLALLCEGKAEKAYELYEDISDDDMPHLTTKLPNTDRWEISSPASFDDTSEAESKAVETTTPTLVTATSDRHSPGHGHVQGHDYIDTLAIAQHSRSCSFYFETDDGFERRFCPKCDCGRQTVPSASCSPSFVLNSEDETDDEIDDYLAIPISVIDLKYAPEDENQDSSETDVLEVVETGAQERPRGASQTAFPSLPVFDTEECFLQAVQCEFALGSSPLVHETDSEEAVSTPQKRRESVDSSDTVDSRDYSSASEHNFLTVSRKMMRKGSATVPSATDDFMSEEEGKGNRVTNILKDQMSPKGAKPRRMSEAKHSGSKQISTVEREDIIVLDSDTEDESVEICKATRKRKRKRGCTASSDIADASCSQQKRHSPRTESQKNTHASACSPTAPRQSRDDAVYEEEMQDTFADVSQSTGKREQCIQTKDVQHKTHIQKSSAVEGVIIIIDSDAEDDNPQNCEEFSREISAVSANGKAPCVGLETAYRGCGPSEAKLQETGPSLADLPQRQSDLHDTHFRGATEAACSYLSLSEQLVEAKGVSAQVLHQAHKLSSKSVVGHHASKEVVKGNSSKKAIPEEITSSGSDGNRDVTQSRCGESARIQAGESADRLSGTANAEPVIPRFLAQPSGNTACLTLLKEPVVHKPRKDKSLSVQTPTSSSKKVTFCENNQVIYLLPPEAADDGPKTENNVQANAQKPAMVSRRRSLPPQEGPSTSFISSSSAGEHCHVAKQRSAYSKGLSPLKGFSLPFNPREQSCPPKRRWSYSSPATSSKPTKGPAQTVQLNATGYVKEQVNGASPNSPLSRSRVTKDIRRRPGLHDKPGRERAPRKKRQSHKTPTTMMKKATNDAIQWTKNRKQASQKERNSVGEGYKWAEKSNVAKPTKAILVGPSRERKGR
uniref:uncharacterized protein LOC120818418 isoform X1 n=1 Tax=Gasterosteus aculeatus aculeatus TaxID=481459 RepID=UPI001A97F4CD|nr:uncharacterized protein LOC120818418 isoform X1 [Gasterosteus aculeatus aculeatus]XP_040031395.1 uncharacterized protein LOC120818418 isoform X1 [Gasterosteus aculeatus aculeatus]XP_040031396.1 uncharacterized protein LOC120818418 isoform X1 [Gasterosteus aculeatus aculeatus]